MPGGAVAFPTIDTMVAVDGLLEDEAGQTLLAAPGAVGPPGRRRRSRTGSQRTAEALTELARRHLEAGPLPKAGGCGPSWRWWWTWTASTTLGVCWVGDRVGQTPGSGGVPAAGLRRRHHPGAGQPPTQ